MATIPQLDRLISERDVAEQTITQILEGVGDDRDISDAEMTQVNATRERVDKLDAQIAPLQELQDRMAAHEQTVRSIASSASEPRAGEPGKGERLTVSPREVRYGSAGEFMVDYVRSMRDVSRQMADLYDADAAQRVAVALGRAATHQTTEDTPGLLPKSIVGEILADLDESRPLIEALGAKDLAGIPGKSFSRPVVAADPKTGSGEQSAEKAEGSSGEVKINGVEFTKSTFLRWMNISRQDIDWTSPAVWDTLIAEMMGVYAEDTEEKAASSLATAVTQTESCPSDDIAGWIAGLYAAKTKVVTAGGTKKARAKRLPDTIFVSYDMDNSLGALIDTHLALNYNAVGTSELNAFGGNILRTPRIMSPGLPAGTVVLGRRAGFEFYEQRIGLLQAIEPKVLGVEVSYGGYAACGAIDATLFCKVTKHVGA